MELHHAKAVCAQELIDQLEIEYIYLNTDKYDIQ